MFTAMTIGLLVMVLFGCSTLAFAFPSEAEPETDEAQAVDEDARVVEVPPVQAEVLFAPTGWTEGAPKNEKVDIAALVASIEEHLRRERAAASAFAADPSPKTLWRH